jgi:hypothetical protein
MSDQSVLPSPRGEGDGPLIDVVGVGQLVLVHARRTKALGPGKLHEAGPPFDEVSVGCVESRVLVLLVFPSPVRQKSSRLDLEEVVTGLVEVTNTAERRAQERRRVNRIAHILSLAQISHRRRTRMPEGPRP